MVPEDVWPTTEEAPCFRAAMARTPDPDPKSSTLAPCRDCSARKPMQSCVVGCSPAAVTHCNGLIHFQHGTQVVSSCLIRGLTQLEHGGPYGACSFKRHCTTYLTGSCINTRATVQSWLNSMWHLASLETIRDMTSRIWPGPVKSST